MISNCVSAEPRTNDCYIISIILFLVCVNRYITNICMGNHATGFRFSINNCRNAFAFIVLPAHNYIRIACSANPFCIKPHVSKNFCNFFFKCYT